MKIGRASEDGGSANANVVVDVKNVRRWAEELEKSPRWQRRRKRANDIADLASKLRPLGRLDELLEVLQNIAHFTDKLFSLAKDEEEPESLRRGAAWTLSQLNDWPSIFNRKVLDAQDIKANVDIDASLPYLPDRPAGKGPGKRKLKGASRESVIELPPEQQVELAERFLPHLDGSGFELRWDTRRLYLGHYFRVLQDPDYSEVMCIQYLYMWSKQAWPISHFFTGYFWPILTILSLFAWATGLRASFTGLLPLLVLSFVLIAYGLARTLLPGKERCLKNDTWYAVGGALLLASFWDSPYAPYVPLLAAVAFWIVTRHVLGPTEHVMDYGPIFVYIRWENGDWRIDGVRYDKFHYETAEDSFQRPDGKLSRYVRGAGVDEVGTLKDYARGDTLFLRTNNMWRSFQLSKPHAQHSQLSYWAYVVAWLGIYVLTAVLLLARAYSGTNSLSSSLSDVSLLLIGLFAVTILIALNDLAVTPMSHPAKPSVTSPEYYQKALKRVLTYHKLVHLWNMSDDKASLVIRKKLQDPFRPARDLSFWRTFRDPSAERLAYEALRKIESLKHSQH